MSHKDEFLIHKQCFISYIDFKLATNKIEMEKSVKNKTTTNQT